MNFTWSEETPWAENDTEFTTALERLKDAQENDAEFGQQCFAHPGFIWLLLAIINKYVMPKLVARR